MTGPLILDSGALIALSRRSKTLWTLLDRAQRAGRDVLVPAGTLVESLRGGPRDALINQLLARPHTTVTVHDEERARRAGGLLAETTTSDPIDALVVAEALRYQGAWIATSDPDDITELADGAGGVVVLRV